MNRSRRRSGFTILELLIVIAIIIALAGLILGTTGYVQKKGARSRAEAEIAAMTSALESYKADNGTYARGSAADPVAATAPFDTDNVDARKNGNPGAALYTSASLYLFQALSGLKPDGTTNTALKSYMSFKPNQLARTDMTASVSSSNPVTALRDPFGNSYGYSTAYAADLQTNPSTVPTRGYNPTFDLWSTSSLTTDPPASNDTITPQWIKNW